MNAHTALAKQFGVTEELLDALYRIDEHRHLFSERELAALRFAEMMTSSAQDIDEELWDELQAHFDDGELIELASVIGLFNFFNRFADALEIHHP
jgi:alkylhydroperoxidase family enzyme